MNRLKRILSALATFKRNPPSAVIRDAWATIFDEAKAIREGDRHFSDALDLIGSVISAVVSIAEDAEKPAAKGTPTPAASATETAS